MAESEREQIEAIVRRVAQDGGTREDVMREIIREVLVRPLVQSITPLVGKLFDGSACGVGALNGGEGLPPVAQ